MVNTEEFLDIGQRVFGVHEKYLELDAKNIKIVVCRVVSYQTIDGIVHPIYKEVGNAKSSPNPLSHIFFKDVKDAIKHITPANGKKAKASKSVAKKS